MKKRLFSIAMAGALVAGLATSAFATIKPTRVGPVSEYGALHAGYIINDGCGSSTEVCDPLPSPGAILGSWNGSPVSVQGMSLTWSQYWPYGSSFYGGSYIDTLVGAWHVELVRAAMGVVPPWGHFSYMKNPAYFESQMDTVVQAAIRNDIYVLIDWHSEGGYFNCIHPGQTPKLKFNDNKECFTAADAAKFFGKMAERYGKYPHVIFEIYNEPVAESWDDLKAYADTVITEIRKYSNNLVIMGTPQWSSQAGDAIKNPIQDKNVAYSYHFYADIHKTDEHTASSQKAIDAGLPVFITEWGGIDKIFSNASQKEQLEKFLTWRNKNKLSSAKWDVEKPFLTDSDVDQYTLNTLMPKLHTYQKHFNWETEIKDSLPIIINYNSANLLLGKWKYETDSTVADGDGKYGHSGAEFYGAKADNGNGAPGTAGATEFKFSLNGIKLDTAGTGYAYAPYVNVTLELPELAYEPCPPEVDCGPQYPTELGYCDMVSYKYKGTNHQFTAFEEWNLSETVYGEGSWDYAFVEMPYSPEWTTVYVDLGWMRRNAWQAGLPEGINLEATTGLRFAIRDEAFDNKLEVTGLSCVKGVKNYTPVTPPVSIKKQNRIASNASNISVATQGKLIAVDGLASLNGKKFALVNSMGQTLSRGTVQGNSLRLMAPRSGRYMLFIRGEGVNITRVISIK